MPTERQIMKFLVPVSVEALGRSDLTARVVVPFYVNPQSFDIQESKLVDSSLTKGGYVVHYWGEQLTKIVVAGTTGSSGIEGINILRKVYRNEIIQFNNLLRERAENVQQDFVSAFGSVGSLNRTANFGDGVRAILDDFTQNGISNIGNGISSALEEISEAARLITDANPGSVELVPTMGAFASNIILYWQGEKFQGYFNSFNIREKADSPGLFDYDFNFTVLKRTGERKNFLGWHRKPVDSSGNYVSASLPKEGPREDELSIPYGTQERILSYQTNPNAPIENNPNNLTSRFTESQNSQNDQNNVGINRRSVVRGR